MIMCINNASLGIKKLLFGLFHTLYAMSPAAPLPPPTPVTGEVVHYRRRDSIRQLSCVGA